MEELSYFLKHSVFELDDGFPKLLNGFWMWGVYNIPIFWNRTWFHSFLCVIGWNTPPAGVFVV